jgi:hypothetical protein
MENNFDFKKYLAENKLTENTEKTSLNEIASDLTFEEIGMLRDGLDLMDELGKISSDDYQILAMKLERLALQK